MKTFKRSKTRRLEFEALDARNLLACDAMVVVGDANHDGYFDSGDLVEVFQSARYENKIPATSQQGDFNCDGVFDSADFVYALQAGNYEGRQAVRDLAAFDIDFEVTRDTEFSGTARITGVVRNIGTLDFNSSPGRQSAQLFEIPTNGRPKLVAQGDFEDLAPGEEFRVVYSRPWDAQSAMEGNYPPEYQLVLIYGLDIGNDGNPENDDRERENNDLVRDGDAINSLFGSPTPRTPIGEGSNSQVTLPRDLYFADVNGDGRDDFLQVADTRLFAYETDYEKTGILHNYFSDRVIRPVTGDFQGSGYDQVCALTAARKLECFESTVAPGAARPELEQWFEQNSFLATNEDSIVADYNGDGRADILVYNRSRGDIRFYTLDANSTSFVTMPDFAIGNLESAVRPRMLIRAGDVNGDGRADVITANNAGQISYYASVWDGRVDTFWWAWTSAGGVVGSNDQFQLARIDNDLKEDLVLHDKSTGQTRFHAMEFNNGRPPALPIATGQIDQQPDTTVHFADLKDPLEEAGGALREDSITFFSNGNGYRRADARWDVNRPTYWWAFTQNTPRNDTGWADFEYHNWKVIKCKTSDNDAEPQNDTFYKKLYTSDGADGVVEYWRDISYGTYDLSDNTVDDEWYVMEETSAELRAYEGRDRRWKRINACIKASGVQASDYTGVIAVLNTQIDAGTQGQVLIDPASLTVTFSTHEMAHRYGWTHSFDDTEEKTNTWSRPGEYYDKWDIMSAMNVKTFKNSQGVTSGPEMNAPYKTKKDFIPQHRIRTLTQSPTDLADASYDIAAINRPEANGLLMLRIGANDNNYYTVEFRQKSGWDRGIPNDAVLVHQVWTGINDEGNREQRSILLTENGSNQDRQPGEVVYLPNGVAIEVESFDAKAQTAKVRVIPAQPIHSTGTFTVRGTYLGDFDVGTEVSGAIEADFHWAQHTSTTRALEPRNGAQFAVMGDAPVGYHQCLAATLSSSPIQANGSNFGDLGVGTWICGMTSEGRITAFEVVSITPRPEANNDITFRFTTWDN